MLEMLKKLVSLAVARNVLLFLELLAIPIAIVAIYQSSEAIRLQTISNREQQVASAWSQLTARAPGNSGKGAALMTLHDNGEVLSGLLIDCETMGGVYVDDPNRRCRGAPFLKGVLLKGLNLPEIKDIESLFQRDKDLEVCALGEPVRITDSDFSGAIFEDATIYCGMILDVNFKNTYFRQSIIADSWLYNVDVSGSRIEKMISNRIEGLLAEGSIFVRTDFRGTYAGGVNFTKAKFNSVNFALSHAAHLNVSGADFCFFENEAFPSTEENCPTELPDEVVAAMWAWSDMPPKGLGSTAEKLKNVRTCSSAFRTASFGNEFEGYGFVHDRGYLPPPPCRTNGD